MVCRRAEALRVGVISDTHGLLRPQAMDSFQAVEHIVHAGDIGKPGIVEALSEIAPVTAIRGNVDVADWALIYPEEASIELVGRRILVLHDRKQIDVVPGQSGIDIVISGHSHRPGVETLEGVLYLNPGAAGPRRFRLPVTLALMELDGFGAQARIVELDV